ELLSNVETMAKTTLLADRIRGLWPSLADWRASWRPILRGSGLGFLLGLVPGGGPVTAAFMSYALEKRIAAQPERFGKGAIEGVAAPESANNSAVAGSLIPVLSLGIPSNPVTALLLGALIIQGIQPGPLFIAQRPDLFWGIVASMYIGNMFLLLLNLPLIGLWVQFLRIPYRVLFPIVLLLALVGTYSANKNVFDLWVMLGFGVAGYALRKLEYDLAPFVIAFVLAPLLEQSLRQALVMSPDGAMILVKRPVTRGVPRRGRGAGRVDAPSQTTIRRRKRVKRSAVALAPAAAVAAPAAAQDPKAIKPKDFPTQPIEYVVVYPAGGGMDVTARLLAKYVEKATGDKILVNNRTGGAGMVGHTYLATQAKPDGYTVGVLANLVWGDAMLRAQGKWAYTDLEPIGYLNSDALTWVGPTEGPLKGKSLKEILQIAKEKPGTIRIATVPGSMWEYLVEQIEAASGAKFLRVPFQGGGAGINALVGG